MSSPSSTAEGFKLVFRRPTIPLAEIAWRWSFGLAAWFLIVVFLIDYANTLPVNTVDRLLLGTQQPALILRAIHRIFHGSGFRFFESGAVLVVAMMVAWVVVASLGRAATLKTIMAELGVEGATGGQRKRISSLLELNLLRAAVALAAVVAGVGSALLANGIWAATHLTATDAARIWLALLFLIWTAWVVLNWSLSTSAIFVIVDRTPVLAAISAMVRWYRNRLGSVVAAGIWFGLAHAGAFIVASGAAFTVLGMASALGVGATIFLEMLIVAVYSAIADLLYTARLSAYVATLRLEPSSELSSRTEVPNTAQRSTIDPSELILSDVPLPAT